MIVRCFTDGGAVARAAVETVVEGARLAVDARGIFRIALAGGATPRMAYERLSEARGIDWSRTEVFFSDDRAVGPDADGSNFRMAREALLARVPVPDARVHRIQGELGAEEAARRYEAELGDAPLDLVLLGMGADGHTASLFPGGVRDDDARRVVPARGPPPHVERVTLTLRALAEARRKVFLVTGASKAARLAEVLLDARSGSPALPAAQACTGGDVEWLVDRAAATELAMIGDELTLEQQQE